MAQNLEGLYLGVVCEWVPVPNVYNGFHEEVPSKYVFFYVFFNIYRSCSCILATFNFVIFQRYFCCPFKKNTFDKTIQRKTNNIRPFSRNNYCSGTNEVTDDWITAPVLSSLLTTFKAANFRRIYQIWHSTQKIKVTCTCRTFLLLLFLLLIL